MREKICIYCKQKFRLSARNPHQRACSSPECQRRRRADYHRRKLATDLVYRDQCRDSRKKWRDKNPDYMKRYREHHGSEGRGNAGRLLLANYLHSLADLVKSDVALKVQFFSSKYILVFRLHAPPQVSKWLHRECFLIWLQPRGPRVRKMRKRKNQRCGPWSEEDDRMLVDLAGLKDLRVIATILHRSKSAVYSRLAILAQGSSAV